MAEGKRGDLGGGLEEFFELVSAKKIFSKQIKSK